MKFIKKLKIKQILKRLFKKLNQLNIITPEIQLKIRQLYKKRKTNNNYHYKTINAKKVLGKKSGYQSLKLIGENWKIKYNNKEIALFFGIDEWQYGFISKYFPEYRTAFIPKKLFNIHTFYILLNLKVKPSVIVVWEYSESYLLKLFLYRKNLPIYRLGDSFIKTAMSKNIISIPYSLVLDKTGFHYDTASPSDIETLFNTYKFKDDTTLLKKAKEYLEIILNLHITKENFVSNISKNTNNIFLKKRVLILNQPKNDLSLKFANPNKYNKKRLFSLVEKENPDAEILYATNPDAEFYNSIDHVYTISSMSALDALLRGIKVTVIGTPIYAGWGLTDDRVKFKNRKSKLTIIELFAGLYLKYPRYLANIKNSYIGLHASCLRISAEKNIYIHDMNMNTNITLKASSSYWPQIFFNKKYNFSTNQEFQIVKKINFQLLLNNNPGILFQTMLLYSIFGVLKHENSRNIFITNVRQYIDFDVFNQFLIDIYLLKNNQYILKHFVWFLSEYKQSKLIQNLPIKKEYNEDEDKKKLNESDEIDAVLLFQILEDYKKNKNFTEAIEIAKKILLSGNATTLLFVRMAEIAELTFDTSSAKDIARFLQKINLHLHNRASIHLDIENFSFDKDSDSKQYLMLKYAKQLILNPDRINRTWGIFQTYFDESDYEIFKSILNLDNNQVFQKALSYLEIDDAKRAKSVIEYLIEEGDLSDKIYVVYAKILFSLCEYEKAMKIIKNAISINATHENYTELLRQLKALGRFEEALKYVKQAEVKKLKLTKEGHIMPIHFGLKNIEEGFKCFLDWALTDKLIQYFGEEKYKQTETLDVNNLLIIFSSGPAEEMRFASIYNELGDRLGYKNFKLTCDHRLEKILKRSFPKINFVPIKRTRFFTPNHPREEYNKLPGSDLCNALDNNGMKAVEEADEIILLTDFLWQFRKNYDSFLGTPYLKVDTIKTKKYKKILPKNTRLIGLSWRSFLTNSMRNVHYLSIKQLEPLFKIPGITYVNFQYDDCDEELSWVNERYPNKLINIEEIDQFNDFDSVASLMMCMELVISPVTAVIDLVGAIGCPGLIFSTGHGELSWRMIDDDGTDIWFHNVKHVNSKFGNKEALVGKLVSELNK